MAAYILAINMSNFPQNFITFLKYIQWYNTFSAVKFRILMSLYSWSVHYSLDTSCQRCWYWYSKFLSNRRGPQVDPMPTQKKVTKEASIWCQVTFWPITQDPGGHIDIGGKVVLQVSQIKQIVLKLCAHFIVIFLVLYKHANGSDTWLWDDETKHVQKWRCSCVKHMMYEKLFAARYWVRKHSQVNKIYYIKASGHIGHQCIVKLHANLYHSTTATWMTSSKLYHSTTATWVTTSKLYHSTTATWMTSSKLYHSKTATWVTTSKLCHSTTATWVTSSKLYLSITTTLTTSSWKAPIDAQCPKVLHPSISWKSANLHIIIREDVFKISRFWSINILKFYIIQNVNKLFCRQLICRYYVK